MSTAILFEDAGHAGLMPLVHWRPVADLRCGRDTLAERMARVLGSGSLQLWVRPALQGVVNSRSAERVAGAARQDTLLVNARWLCTEAPADGPTAVVGMHGDDIAYVRCDKHIARCLDAEIMLDATRLNDVLASTPRCDAGGHMVRYPWDLIVRNGALLHADAESFEGRATVPGHVQVIGPESVYVADGVLFKPGVVLDAASGPILIDRDVVVMPNAVIEGPTYIGPCSQVAAGAWIRGSVSIGPYCKVGGEVSVSVFQGYSNKAHHGFVGHSILGEWVNIGAGTTTSNLKNTYGEISVARPGSSIRTGQTFLGSIIGDFVKTGINQALTTGCVIGCGTMIATGSVSPRFMPSFRFVTDRGDQPYDIARCLEVATRTMARRELAMTPEERSYFEQLPERVGPYEVT